MKKLWKIVGIFIPFYLVYLIMCWVGYTSPIHKYMFGTYKLSYDGKLYLEPIKDFKYLTSSQRAGSTAFEKGVEFEVLYYEYEYMIDSEISLYMCKNISTGEKFAISSSYFEYIEKKD